MSEFWTFGKYVSWEHCIRAAKQCNLENCPDTLNCCSVNCIGMPTIKGIVLLISITTIILFFIIIFNIIREPKKKLPDNDNKTI